MATDDKNNDPEQDDFFGDDDDDFGLPELEYEALDDDSDSAEDESFDDLDDDFASDMADDMDADDLGDMDDISEDSLEDDLNSDASSEETSDDGLDLPDDFDEEIPDQISDEELEAAMDDEISDEELNEFYEEESFEDFETGDADGEDAGSEMTDSVFDSDGLGMDDGEFGSFEQSSAAETETANTNEVYSSADNQEAKGKFTRLVVIGVVVFVTLGIASLFIYNSFLAEDEKPVAAKVEKKKPVKKPVAKPVEKKEEPKADPTPVKKEPVKAQPNPSTPGTVNSLVERTGNTHVIIASFLDEDMAADYANELAAAGKSPSLIPPFGNAKTTRIAISSYPSLADAQGDVENFKSEYGPNVWLLKY